MKNPEKVRAYRENNRERLNELSREHYQRNREARIKYINAHRKGRLKDATPPWATKADIRKFYMNCPEGYHVDHIVPLHGELVSGLHVLENLQYLPADENLKKGNRFALHEKW